MISTMDSPQLEFAFAIRLWFTRTSMVPDIPTGGWRSAVYVDGGEIDGPRMKGRAVPNSGGDYAHFRPDDTAVFDARYMLETDAGAHVEVWSRGLRVASPEVMARMAAGEAVAASAYYMRTAMRFDTAAPDLQWLVQRLCIGIGERRPDRD